MAPWSPDIMEAFLSIKPDLESDFTPAAYNKLLNTLFPVNTPYSVFPQVHRHEDLNYPTARTTFTIYYRKTPVFLLDLHSRASLGRLSSRTAADNHMRMHVQDLLPYCNLPILYAISTFGTRMAFYTVTEKTRAITPTLMGAGPDDTTPVDWWDCDVLEDDGAIRLKEVVNKIRNQCEHGWQQFLSMAIYQLTNY